MKRNPFYKTLQALALLLLALATMAGAATGLDTDPDTQELYVNMPVSGTNTVEITADDIANGLTSFMVYDDGGKEGKYSYNADGYLTITAPKGYMLQVSGTVKSEGKLSVFDGENSQATPLLSEFKDGNIGKRISTGNVVTFYFLSTSEYVSSGLDLKVDLLKTELNLAEDGVGGYYVNMLAQNTATLNITTADIANGLTTFKVYDDGGQDGYFSYNADGYLTITAPEGYVLQVSGTVYVGEGFLSVFDGDNSQATPLLSEFYDGDIGKRISTGNVMTFYFKSTTKNSYNFRSGLNLTVNLLKTELKLAEDGEGGYYVNMLAQNTATLNITAADIANGVTSFKVYDDGGKEDYYSYNADGYLTITAPEGYVLQVSGTVYVSEVFLSVFDGENSQVTPLLSEFYQGYQGDIGKRISTGNVMTFYFQSTSNSAWNGLDLTVNVIKMNLSLAEDGEGGYYVNMLAQNTATLDITADDIANGITSFNVYDDGGKEGKYSWNADGYLTITVPEDYVLQVSGTMKSYNSYGKLSVFDGENSQATPLLSEFYDGDIGKRVSAGNVITFYFLSASEYVYDGLNLTVNLLKKDLSLAEDGEGGYYVNMRAQNTATLNITTADIANGITSFNVYDDGGKDGNYSYNADGYLTITAPEGYVLQMSGTMKSYNSSGKLSVFDGENSQATLLLDECTEGNEVGTRISTGNVMTFYFQSTSKSTSNSASDGLDLTVNVIKMNLSLAEDGEGGYYVNMLAQNTATLDITADDIANGITSFNVYDDGGKDGNYSYNADGYLTITAPEGYVLQMSGTVYRGNENFSVFDGGNSQATPLLQVNTFRDGYDIGTLISTDNAVTFYFQSTANSSSTVSYGLDLTVKVVKMDLALAKDGEGAYYVNMPAQNTATLNITDADIANGVTSFNIYDDGGVEYDHSWNVNGYLTITAPKDYVLQLTEKAKTFSLGDDRCLLSVFDGNATASPLLTDFEQDFSDGDIGTVVSSGNVMTIYLKSKWNNHTTAPGLELKATLVRRGFGAVTITKAGDGKFRATIDGTYTGTDTLSIPNKIEVDEVDYDRELEVGVPVTAMLPVALPEGASVNADFYTLEKVEQVDDRWRATMAFIGKDKVPQPNTPYAVILPEGETKLEFNLNGKKATVQTGAIHSVCGLDKDCVLDEKGNITDDWFFTGTYAYKVWNGADEENGIEQHPELGLAYAFAATDNPGGADKGKFGRVVAGAYANPMRCYLRKRDASVKLVKAQQVAAASYVARYSVNYVPETETIDVEFVKDDAKGGRTVLHGRMNTVTGEFKMLRDFDLKGRKVNSANKARGAYYGKKVLKK